MEMQEEKGVRGKPGETLVLFWERKEQSGGQFQAGMEWLSERGTKGEDEKRAP